MKFFKLAIKHPDVPESWRELTLFSGYRLFLATTLFFVFYLGLPPDFLGEASPATYNIVSQFYLLTAIFLFIVTVQRWGGFELQLVIQSLIDIIVLTLLIHTSGGLQTGLGSLLVVVVVASGTLIPGRIALFISALAALAVLLEVAYSQIIGGQVPRYSHAGMLGATFFATVLLAQSLSKKILASQQLAEQRKRDLAKLASLNKHIISRMQTGIIVVEPSGKIQHSNESAQILLGIEGSETGEYLKNWSPILSQQVWGWQNYQTTPFEPFQPQAELPQILASAMKLDSGEVVLYLENTTAVAQQVQQLKLASLGRLTASIAHEIRNPLGAISHAGELLAEAADDDKNLTKLTDIIARHSARVNGIIETVLQMSRRKTVEPSAIVLANWLQNFIDEFSDYNHVQKGEIELDISSPLSRVYIDIDQFQQIIANLVDNAWHYSSSIGEMPRVQLNLLTQNNDVIIDIIDNGPGVSSSALPQLFEPFNTERQGGTGLGLYLARELCQANGARLNYYPEHYGKSCFRITIPVKQHENLQ